MSKHNPVTPIVNGAPLSTENPMPVTGASGGATESKQDAAITQETAINTVLGIKTDAKSTATDGTAISAMAVWKQISASVQAIAASVASLVTGTVLAAGTSIVGKFGIDQTTPGTTNRVTVGDSTVVDVTLSLDTSVYASGDLLAETQIVTSAMRVADFGGFLTNLMVIDKDDQGAALDIYLLDANVSMGSENSAPSITDGNAASILCRIQVGTGDYYDLGGVKVADISGLARAIKPASGTTNLYVAVVNGTGTPTYTATGVVLRLGFGRD